MTIKWTFRSSMAFDTAHILKYRGKYKGRGCQLEIMTPKKKTGGFGKQVVAFFADGDERQFNTEEELVAAIEEVRTVKQAAKTDKVTRGAARKAVKNVKKEG